MSARADHRIGQSGQGCRHGRQYWMRGGRRGAQQGLDERRDGLVGVLCREGRLRDGRLRLALEPQRLAGHHEAGALAVGRHLLICFLLLQA